MAIYTATFVGQAVTAQEDVFELVAPADMTVEVREIRLGQYSDFGDAQAEILSVQIIRGYTTSGSGGAAATPANLMPAGKAAGSTVEVNNTTVASGGLPEVLIADVMNVQAGWWFYPMMPPYPRQLPSVSEAIKLAAGQRLVVRVSAPADSLTMNGTLVFEELAL